MAELLPCPFCGVVPKAVELQSAFQQTRFSVWCNSAKCEIHPFTTVYAEKAKAIEAWNRRAGDGK